MLKKTQEIIQEEDSRLADYAVRNEGSDDRIHDEPGHDYRLPFQRDKDRIIHSRAFRRLEYKTQVFIASIGDNYRTRLTHTMEVAALSRTVAQNLGLNSYLSEAIALAHDLGHAPFGHAGQDILAEIMRGKGGFEHNKQSLRVVRYLENRYAGFSGLNLCRETLVGIMKHGGDYDLSDSLSDREERGPSLEAEITDLCDSIAYNNHDVEDGLESGLIVPEDLSSLSIWDENFSMAGERFKGKQPKLVIRETIRSMMNTMVVDFLETTSRRLQEQNVRSREDLSILWKNRIPRAGFSESMEKKVRELKQFLHDDLYKHPEVVQLSDFGKEIIRVLYEYFEKNPKEMPESYRNRLHQDGLPRVVCDYIAGMTDRFAEEIAIDKELIDPFG